VFHTVGWWYSVEKEGKGLIIQRAKDKGEVLEKEGMRSRRYNILTVAQKFLSRKTIDDVVAGIELIRNYQDRWNVIDSGDFAKGFAEFLNSE
jgi:hypothetical protein